MSAPSPPLPALRTAAPRRQQPPRRPHGEAAAGLLALQRAAGNRAVQQLVGRARQAPPPGPRPVVQRYTVVPWGGFATAGAPSFATQVRGGNPGFTVGGAPNIVNAHMPALRVSQNGQLAVQDANLGNTQPKVMYASPDAIKHSNAALMRTGSQFILVGDASRTVTVTVAGATVTLEEVVPVDVAAGLGGYAGNQPAGTSGSFEISQKCNEAVQEVMGGASSPTFADPTFNVPHQMVAGSYAAESIAPPTAAGQPTMANVDYRANAASNLPTMEGVADRYGRLVAGGGGRARVRQLGVNKHAKPKVGEGYFTQSLDPTETMVPGQNPADPARLVDMTDPYHNRVVQMPANQRKQRVWGFHYAGVVAQDGDDRVTLENYARTHEGGNAATSKDQQYYFQMYGKGAQSFHEAWAAIGHGGKEFVNPLTMMIKRAGSDQHAFDASAQRHFGAQWNQPQVADAHADLVVAANADEQTVPMLKGLAWAKGHIALGDRVGRGKLKSWINAATGAAPNQETAALRTYLLQQLGHVKRSRNPFS